MKRKAREQIATGMQDVKAALSAVEHDIPASVQASVEPTSIEGPSSDERKLQKPRPGQIGEGRGTPLSKAQRKRALWVFSLLLSEVPFPGTLTPL